jgi:hypothetical protein
MSDKELPFGADEESILLGHQPDKVNIPTILIFGVALVVVCAVVFVVLAIVMGFFERLDKTRDAQISPMMSDVSGLYPEPRLQASPPRDMSKYAAEVRAKQDSYGWVDPKAKIARIPISRAIDLSLEKGIFKAPAATTTAPEVPAATESESAPAAPSAPATETAPVEGNP